MSLGALELIAKMVGGIVVPLLSYSPHGSAVAGHAVLKPGTEGYVGGEYRFHYCLKDGSVQFGSLVVSFIRMDRIELYYGFVP